MANYKTVIIILFATLSMGTVLSASASGMVFLVEGMEVLSGEEFAELSANSGNAVFKSSGANIEVTCNATTDTGKIKSGGASAATITFKTCTVSKPSATCQVTEPITIEAKDQLVTESDRPLDEFKPNSGTTFATVHFTNCSLEEIQVEGTARALVEGSGTVTGELNFTSTSGSSLTAGGSSMTFTLKENAMLEGNKNWGVCS